MSFFGKVIDFLGGGVGETIVDTVKDYFPPRMSDAERMQIEEAIRQAAREHELQLIQLAQAEQQAFDQRTQQMEGTAKDLQQFGTLGKLVVFLRGMQRPIWGFFVLYLDYQVFINGKWPTVANEASNIGEQGAGAANMALSFESAFWMINFLVLGFLFGERAMRNVVPLLQKKLGQNSANSYPGDVKG